MTVFGMARCDKCGGVAESQITARAIQGVGIRTVALCWHCWRAFAALMTPKKMAKRARKARGK
jgi:hypothetical protein